MWRWLACWLLGHDRRPGFVSVILEQPPIPIWYCRRCDRDLGLRDGALDW